MRNEGRIVLAGADRAAIACFCCIRFGFGVSAVAVVGGGEPTRPTLIVDRLIADDGLSSLACSCISSCADGGRHDIFTSHDA